MRRNVLLVVGAYIVNGLLAVPASAQDTGRTDPTPPPVTSGTNPPADTQAPGKTATDAITNPAQVPPSDGQVGTGAPPVAGGPTSGPAVTSTPRQ